LAGQELGHDAPQRPHVHCGPVAPAAHQLLRRAILRRAHAPRAPGTASRRGASASRSRNRKSLARRHRGRQGHSLA
jgi:hypothetical protein